MKILFSWGWTPKKTTKLYENVIKEWESFDYEITSINYREELGIDWPYSASVLNNLYINKDPILMKHYNKIKLLSKTHDVLIASNGNIYHPNYLQGLDNLYKVFICDDDPDSSEFLAKPYVHTFDHSFTGGIYYNETTKVITKYKEWGAKRANWRPIGVWESKYSDSLTEDQIANQNRDIDLIFVGAAGRRFNRVAHLKTKFPRMHLYGRNWDKFAIKGLLPGSERRIVITSGLWKTKSIKLDQFVPLYQRSKIGVNIHLTYGPINQRLYELPANGVMQICDCSNGLGDVYDVGKEVIGYRTMEEAVELVNYYLDNDGERKKIAIAGFKRVMKDYLQQTIFHKMRKQIVDGMLEDGYTHYKNGSKIKLLL